MAMIHTIASIAGLFGAVLILALPSIGMHVARRKLVRGEPIERCQACSKSAKRSKMYHACGGVVIVCMDPTACRKRSAAR